jgi:hypothetical protein
MKKLQFSEKEGAIPMITENERTESIGSMGLFQKDYAALRMSLTSSSF